MAAGSRSDPAPIGLVLLAIEAPASGGDWVGLAAFLDHLFREGLACIALAAAPRRHLDAWLERHDCGGRLPLRVCAEDGCAAPPDPAAPLLAASRLAIPVRNCLAIADGLAPAQAALRAGCAVVALGGGSARAAMQRAGIASGVERLDALLPLRPWHARRSLFGAALGAMAE